MCGPLGTGMEETYQMTAALKHLPCGKHVALLTDARFSGVSTGACIGHVGPEALAGGPIGRVRDGDRIRSSSTGPASRAASTWSAHAGRRCDAVERRPPPRRNAPRTPTWRPTRTCRPTRACGRRSNSAGGGTWGGCVFDVNAIALKALGGAR